MNNKGFTLIEILAVVAIIASLGVIITISVTKTLENTKVSQCEEFVKKIEKSACAYVALKNKSIICNRNDCPPFKLSVLVEEGYITEEIDPCTNDNINLNSTVSVTWDNMSGEKICNYNGVKVYER